jgi:hypothetical protein
MDKIIERNNHIRLLMELCKISYATAAELLFCLRNNLPNKRSAFVKEFIMKASA